MGCDIHVYIEKNTDKKYNSWEQVSLYRINKYSHNLEVASPYDGRDYELFSILAGVRGWLEPLVYPRGIPENMSQEVEKEYCFAKEDFHTPTWYDLTELLLYKEKFKNQDFEDQEEKEAYERFEFFIRDILTYLEFAGEFVYNPVPGTYRVIMWFDS